jgi:hypothetical protein
MGGDADFDREYSKADGSSGTKSTEHLNKIRKVFYKSKDSSFPDEIHPFCPGLNT